MNIGAARAANHVDGSGETIGILSDSFDTASLPFPDHAAHDVAYGELPGPGNPCGHPTPVEVLSDFDNSAATDEGRAMAQAAHDLAPGASLAFATSEGGELAFANQITALRTQAHASVLVDDVVYPNEPFFQDGPVANAARAATVAGVPYFSSAGNANVIVGGNNVGSYEAPAYRTGACPTFTNLGYSVLDCHDFDPGAGVDSGDGITVATARRLRSRSPVGRAARRGRDRLRPLRGQFRRQDPRRVRDRQRLGTTADRVPQLGQHDDVGADGAHRRRALLGRRHAPAQAGVPRQRRDHRGGAQRVDRRRPRRARHRRPHRDERGGKRRRDPVRQRPDVGVLLVARAGDPLLRPGAGHERPRQPRSGGQARLRGDRRRAEQLLRATRGSVLALLRHVGRRAPGGRDRRVAPIEESAAHPRAREHRAARHRARGDDERHGRRRRRRIHRCQRRARDRHGARGEAACRPRNAGIGADHGQLDAARERRRHSHHGLHDHALGRRRRADPADVQLAGDQCGHHRARRRRQLHVHGRRGRRRRNRARVRSVAHGHRGNTDEADRRRRHGRRRRATSPSRGTPRPPTTATRSPGTRSHRRSRGSIRRRW